MSLKLYELTEQYRQVQAMADDTTDPQMIIDTLESIGDDIESKIINIAKIKKGLDAEAAVIKTEEDRLKSKRQTVENHAERLRKYIEDTLALIGKEKIKTPILTVAMQANKPGLNLFDEQAFKNSLIEIDGAINEFYIEQPAKLDREKLFEKLQSGLKFSGADIKQTKSLRIR